MEVKPKLAGSDWAERSSFDETCAGFDKAREDN
jgi:hypothetical protein